MLTKSTASLCFSKVSYHKQLNISSCISAFPPLCVRGRGKHSAWMSTVFRRRTSRTQSGRSPVALPLPLTLSLRKEKVLAIEFLIRDKHGGGHIPQIPDKVRKEIARCLLPDIIAFFESKKGQKEFEEWKAQQKLKQKENSEVA